MRHRRAADPAGDGWEALVRAVTARDVAAFIAAGWSAPDAVALVASATVFRALDALSAGATEGATGG